MNYGAYAIVIIVVALGMLLCFESVILPMLVRLGVVKNDFNDQEIVKYFDDSYGKLTNTSAEVNPISPDRIAEKAPTEKTETASPAPAVDVNALRREAQATALGVLLAHGLIKDGKRTEATKAVFGGVSGEAYSKVAAAVREAEENELAKIMITKVTEESGERLLSIRAGKADERTIPM